MYIIATNHKWHEHLPGKLAERTGERFGLITEKAGLTREKLQELRPRAVFFPHWSYTVPADIYEGYECVMFHATDLPYGRGGSPIQNLIARGVYETKITAFRCTGEVDGGPVYLKKPLSLYGTAREIFMRSAAIVEVMIAEIIINNCRPQPQQGEPTFFARRSAADGELGRLDSLDKVFDYIRMLDAEGYPRAFVETDHLRLEFERASRREDCVVADVKITLKERGGNE